MRLLSVIHGPAFGGAHNQALRLAGPLHHRGVETLVALPIEARAASDRLRGAGVETVLLPLHRLRAAPDPAIQARFVRSIRREVRSLRELIRNRGIDVVQAHGPVNPHAALAARAEKTAVVWQLLDTRTPMALRWAARPAIGRLADVVTTWGRELAAVHPGTERFGPRLITVYPPVDLDAFVNEGRFREAARDELGLPSNALAVGSVGVLNPQKGHEHFIATAEAVLPTRPDCRFVVLGSSSPAHAGYEAKLRRRAVASGLSDGRLEFVDPKAAVPRLMQALDVLVLASTPRSEGMPTVILEAMASGKPVLATDVGAVRELVTDGETGLVVPAGDLDAMTGSLLRLLDDAALRTEMGEAGRARALKHFDLEALADLHAGAYAAALTHRAAHD